LEHVADGETVPAREQIGDPVLEDDTGDDSP
jgi:hypothetical protein